MKTPLPTTAGHEPNTSGSFRPHLTQGRSAAAVKGAFWSGLNTLVPTLSATMVFFAAAYFLTPAEFGLVGLAAGIVSIALAFSPAAFGEALIQRQSLATAHADTIFALSMAYGVGAALLLILAAPLVAHLSGEPALIPVVQVLALRVPFDMAAAVPSALIVRDMRFKAVAVRTAVATTIAAVVSFGLLLLGFGLWALIVSQVAASVVIAAMAFWAARWRPGARLSRAAFRDLMSYGFFASGNRMLGVLRLDHIVIGAMGGAAMLGLYVFANKLYRMLSDVVAGALSSVAHALLSTLQGEPEKMRRAFGMAVFAAASVGFPVFAGAALVVDDLIRILLKPDWGDVQVAAQVFCLAGLLATVSIVQGSLIKSKGRADWWFYYQLFQTATTVLAIVIFVPIGLDAMIFAIVGKTVLAWPISVFLTAKLLNIGLGSYLRSFAAPAVATLVMALAVWLVSDLTTDLSPVLSLGLQVATGIVLYTPLLAWLARANIAELRRIILQRKANAA